MLKTVPVTVSVVLLAIVAYAMLSTTTGVLQGNSVNENLSDDDIIKAYNALPEQAKQLYFQQSDELTKAVPERLVELDKLNIGCFGPSTIIGMSSSEMNLGGQCCGALKNLDAYDAQLLALKNFIDENGALDFIPLDPYNISIEHAKALIAFDSSISLSAAQQQLYDEAVEMSHHGGPCCCKCWKWYVMSGLAKKLIVDHDWDSHRIAQLWDFSSSCGHEEDTNMHEHYTSASNQTHDDAHDSAHNTMQ